MPTTAELRAEIAALEARVAALRRELRAAEAAARQTRTEKRCGTCKTVKPLAAFGPDRTRADGHRNRCRVCDNAARRAHPRPSRAAEQRAWKAKNPDKVKLYQERYKARHPEWRAQARARYQRWRARQRAQPPPPPPPGLAAGDLYQAHAPRILRYLVRLVHDPEVAADLCGDVFVAVVKDLPRYEDRGYSVAAWLYAIARGRAINWKRRQALRTFVPLDERIVGGGDVAARIEANALAAELWEAPELTAAQRAVLRLRYHEDLGLDEVAARLGLAKRAVKALQARALKRLRLRLAVLE